MNSRGHASSGGVGVFTVIGIVFVVLKLLNLINWSWVWVLSPFWIPVVFVFLLLGLLIIISAFRR